MIDHHEWPSAQNPSRTLEDLYGWNIKENPVSPWEISVESHFFGELSNPAAHRRCYKLVGWLECLPKARKSAWQVKSAQVPRLDHIVAFFLQRLSATGVLTVL